MTDFYHDKLMNNTQVLNYLLNERKLSLETIKKFKLGYSNKDNTKLLTYIKNKKMDINFFLKTFLIYKNYYKNIKNDNDFIKQFFLCDALNDCIIIPIMQNQNTYHFYKNNFNKKITRYTPKYKSQINFSNTDIFLICYGFTEAQDTILKTKTAIIHEGFFDVINCHNNNIKNVIGLITITKLLSNFMLNFFKKKRHKNYNRIR
ncbi:hypothetical protein [Candidatus Phytoplasma ziziphi]|uniref:hypothetical protein n=1 Tax=Ziziphus jujuba witches'-broom phytoplasma TaxID=135727 RepID=UPI002286F003|nr:hypothetical protein [Candidatus Phytoplasma ziziphi]